jgi:hypothetical protein
VFEEDKRWNWDKRHEEVSVADLEWGENEKGAILDTETGEEGATDFNNNTREEDGADFNNNTAEFNNNKGGENPNNNPNNPPNTDDRRGRRPPVWMEDYETGQGFSEDDVANLVMFAAVDPVHFEDAVRNEKWRKAMDSEIQAIEKNDTWELKELPVGGRTIGVKWVNKTKLNENGEVDKYKARLVAKGYSQQHGIDYTEVFAPVARLDTIRLVIALAAQSQWNIYQLDVKSAFLHGELNEEVFIKQPQGYVHKGSEQKVYKLKKALYGLKQAPRAWYSRIEAHFVKAGFERCHFEHILFTKTAKGGKILIVSLYVDDLIFTKNDESMFVEFKRSMMLEFDMTDLGKMRYFLDIEVIQRAYGIFISQKKNALEVLEKFGMKKMQSGS